MAYPRATTAALSSLRSLRRKGPRAESDRFIVEGPKLIREAMDAGWEVASMLVVPAEASRHEAIRGVLDDAEAAGIVVQQCTPKEMTSISPTEQPQGILATVKQRHYAAGDIPEQSHIILALDGVQDPGNVGTCIRSAAWFGAGGVLLGAGCASVFNDKTVRASAGSMFHIPCVEGIDLSSLLRDKRSQGYHVVGTDGQAPHHYAELSESRRLVLVLGSEASGISREVREIVETYVSIPRQGPGESLNVSIAGSIILAHYAQFHGSGEL